MDDTTSAPWAGALCSQYIAALTMLRDAVDECADDVWGDPAAHPAYWHLAYHVAFYADLYLCDREDAYEAPTFHRENLQFLPGKYPHPPYDVAPPAPAVARADVLAWVDRIIGRCAPQLDALTPETCVASSGFSWLPMSRLERHLYNLRHIQHHTGQLSQTLRRRQGAGVGWIGMG